MCRFRVTLSATWLVLSICMFSIRACCETRKLTALNLMKLVMEYKVLKLF